MRHKRRRYNSCPITRIWNWQQEDWPEFRYDASKLDAFEAAFLRQSGVFSGAVKHVGDEDRQQLTVELISDEALKTSEIEGEFLNRDSLQSSIRRNFGLASDNRKIPPAEQGISQMMVDLYRHFDAPLTDKLLFHWHEMLMNGRRDMKDIGRYRTDESPMQVVSGPLHAPKVHFEAPPSQFPAQGNEAVHPVVQSHRAERESAIARPHPRRNRAPVFCLHPSV